MADCYEGLEALKTYTGMDTFKNESELCNFLEANIEDFCDTRLGARYKTHSREFPMTMQMFGSRPKRIDFLVELEDGTKVGIECKGTRNATDAISQILGYSMYNRFNRMVIVSSKYDPLTQDIIERYKLPITYFCLNREYVLEYKK